MWHWDQGHLAYFQFDALRQIALFVVNHDFKTADRPELRAATGLDFAGPDTHSPWRNYSRVLRLCLLVSEVAGEAQATPVAHILAKPGSVTCDEYLHFLLCTFTEPSPALEDWRREANFRYPLLFSLKYLLTKAVVRSEPFASIDEIIGAYHVSGLVGDEDEAQFVAVVKDIREYVYVGKNVPDNLRRQARESLKVISQISYLHVKSDKIVVSLHPADAHDIFHDLAPIGGIRANNREAEIRRLAALFEGGSTSDFFNFPNTIITEVVESGFVEGTKIQKTHVVIERNASLRKEFFAVRPTSICDICRLDTAQTYPWMERVMDIHHLLPLSSGTRVEAEGTTLEDLVAICPTCHRAVHRYYGNWLSENSRADFTHRGEARHVYRCVKDKFLGAVHE